MTVIPHLIPLKKLKKAKIRNRHNQVPQQIQDTIWENDQKHREASPTRETRSQPFLSQGDHKTAGNKQDIKLKTIVKHE